MNLATRGEYTRSAWCTIGKNPSGIPSKIYPCSIGFIYLIERKSVFSFSKFARISPLACILYNF